MLQPQNVRRLSARQTTGINGFYDLSYADLNKMKSVKGIRELLDKMQPSSNDYDPR